MSQAMQQAEAAPVAEPSGVVSLQGRTLFLTTDSAWVDGAFDAESDEVIAIKFASEAYFTLLRLFPEARDFAALGNRVTFFFNGHYVQIGEMGAETMTEEALQKHFEL